MGLNKLAKCRVADSPTSPKFSIISLYHINVKFATSTARRSQYWSRSKWGKHCLTIGTTLPKYNMVPWRSRLLSQKGTQKSTYFLYIGRSANSSRVSNGDSKKLKGSCRDFRGNSGKSAITSFWVPTSASRTKKYAMVMLWLQMPNCEKSPPIWPKLGNKKNYTYSIFDFFSVRVSNKLGFIIISTNTPSALWSRFEDVPYYKKKLGIPRPFLSVGPGSRGLSAAHPIWLIFALKCYSSWSYIVKRLKVRAMHRNVPLLKIRNWYFWYKVV